LRAAIVLVSAAVVWAGWHAFKLWRAWQNVERVEFNVAEARQAIGDPANPYLGTEMPDEEPALEPPEEREEEIEVIDPNTTTPTSPRVEPDALQAFLVIGSDQRPQTGPSSRADVIVLFLVPSGDADPIMVSIPRDLYLPNPCTGGMSRINANLNGCGDLATGPELLAVAVEDFTGIEIDHFAVFDFEGFKQVINRVGGVEICVEYPVRDSHTDPSLDLPAGCTVADGDQTLAWVRSRKTQELVDGVWRTMPGVSDLERNQRQQALLLEALNRLKGFRSVNEFSALVEDLSDAFAIDKGLSLTDAIGIAWDLRDLEPGRIARPTIPVSYYVTEDGAYVLLPTSSFADVLGDVYPEVTEVLAGG
jgi:LCP family protein required for cell wall assembly